MNTAMGDSTYLHAVVLAEVRGARRDHRRVDRQHLRAQTGLSWDSLERLIAKATLDLKAEWLRRHE